MLSSVRLQRFRSYRDESFEFNSGVNIIVGPNASGKTNLLESILVASTGGSYRVKDAELVAFGAPWSRIDAVGTDFTRVVKLLVQDNGMVKKEFVINDQKFSRLSLQKTIPVVLFEPNHLLLLHGKPDLRRDYLDNLLEQTTPGYSKARRDYRRILMQRNALLKRGQAAQGQLFAWNIRLSEAGAVIAQHRHTLVAGINNKIGDLYRNLAHSKAVDLQIMYTSGFDISQYSSSMLHTLEARQAVDIERGFTTVGPHREDISITLDNRYATEVASRGETRTVLLGLKIIELQLLEESRGSKPILLLDDVFSELDGKRRKSLTEVISGYQTFITTTDADVVVQHFMNNCNIIPLG